MIAYFLERPYWIAIFVALIILTLFVCLKAGQASSRRHAQMEKNMKKLKEEKELRVEFANLSPSLAENADPERLFKGTALNLQKRVADKTDMLAEFETLSEEQKGIYSLALVIEDGAERLSAFFEANGQPVTGEARKLLNKIADNDICDVFEKEYLAFDKDDETTSFIPDEIKALDKEFAELDPYAQICANAGKFICKNIEKFI